MPTYSTRQAAKKLGITDASLVRYMKAGKVPKPKSATSGGMTIHFWTEEEIEHVRQLLPKIFARKEASCGDARSEAADRRY